MGREYRNDCTAHQGHTEAYGYPFQTRSLSDNGLFSEGYFFADKVRLMLDRDIPLYYGSQVDWLKPLSSLYHFGIAVQSPY
jgi:hypothetical protein